MIQTMTCIWWAISILLVIGIAFNLKELITNIRSSQFDGFKVFEEWVFVIVQIACLILAQATICAIKLAGGGW